MRIPNTISKSYLQVYALPHNVYIRKERLRGDCVFWDANFIKTLRELCLQSIANNWEKYPRYEELELDEDKSILIDLLKPNLPLELVIPKLHNDIYWKRAYQAHWPRSYPQIKFIPRSKDVCSVINDNINEIQSLPNVSDDENRTISSRCSSYRSATSIKRKSSSDIERIIKKYFGHELEKKSWKVHFLERHLEEELERMKPDMFNPEYIKELTDLLGPYILSLELKQLKASSDESTCDHISLHSLLARLPNLIEFSVCFAEERAGENFSWHLRKVSENDCKLLGNGVAKSKMKTLRILRSNIDCNKIKLVLRPIIKHATLKVLDLSHCKIADEGAAALAEMFLETPGLETAILSNNKIGPKGAEALAHYLCVPESRLLELNLKLNPIKLEGGKHVSTALARGALSLQSITLAGCGLTHENINLSEALALNNTLKKLDLSNNRLGEEFGENLLKCIHRNKFLKQVDLRMCGISAGTVQNIEKILKRNLTATRDRTIISDLSIN